MKTHVPIPLSLFTLATYTLLVQQSLAASDRGVGVREITFDTPPYKGFQDFGEYRGARIISTKAQLKEQVKEKKARRKIMDEVDFRREIILLFRWSGSGLDRLVLMKTSAEIRFDYTRGKTRDLRPYYRIFAIDKDATVRIDGKRVLGAES